jgi:hypothetical protein
VDRGHAAVFFLAAEPAKKGTLEQPNIQPVGLRPPLLMEVRNARRMNDVRFYTTCAQPACQPKAVAAGLEGSDNALDGAAGLDSFVTSATQQLE